MSIPSTYRLTRTSIVQSPFKNIHGVYTICQKGRLIHSTHNRAIRSSPPKGRDVAIPQAIDASQSTHEATSCNNRALHTPPRSTTANCHALDCLPLSQILRTYLITAVSSSPSLLSASSSLLRRMIDSKNAFTSVERNPLLRLLLWETFYKQFCAGETQEQVSKTCAELRQQGYGGVILEYALEVLKDAEGNEIEDVATWRNGMLRSIDLSAEGDFVGLKWSGMGPAAMHKMTANEEPSPRMVEAMNAVCKAAAAKDIALLPAAEETWSLEGFNNWCMNLQKIYNRQGKSVIYTTYQAYLLQTPETLSKHLATAKAEGFTLCAKLVRGAYLGSEKRSLIHPSIEATHSAYDALASALIHRRYNETLKPCTSSSPDEMPSIHVCLATHNAESVRKAQAARQQQAARGEELTPLSFAQLQGMADEVSCSLLAAAKGDPTSEKIPSAKVYKCTTWGTMPECLNYLLRRAAENKDAASRTKETRMAMQTEIARRSRRVIGLP